jgi:SAM-dependent methyltransferase
MTTVPAAAQQQQKEERDAIPFGEYSAIYDLIYADKNYPGEARYVAELIERFSARKGASATVIDLACGTGRHAFELASLGYAIEGSDISAGMIGVARAQAAARALPVRFHNHSFQTADAIEGQFDVALALFASLGYLTHFDDFSLALANVRKRLVPGGIFIFDLWNGAAVLPGYSAHKVRKVGDAQRQVERISRTAVDAIAQQARVEFEFKVAYADGTARHFSEEHRVRFYFAQEMSDLLPALGFEVLLRCPFLSPGRPLGADDWNMTFVARPKTS